MHIKRISYYMTTGKYISNNVTITVDGYGTFVIPSNNITEILALLQRLQAIKSPTESTMSRPDWRGREVLNG
jgi:hypothetical protein